MGVSAGEALDEPRLEAAVEAQGRCRREPARRSPCRTDPDGDDVERGGDFGGRPAEPSQARCRMRRLLNGEGVVQQLLGSGITASLHPEPTDGVDGLRGEADVAHDGDSGWTIRRTAGAERTPFELDRLGAPFLNKARRSPGPARGPPGTT